jgi:hypothetical protein
MDTLHLVKPENSQLIIEIRKWRGIIRLIDQSKRESTYELNVVDFLNRAIDILNETGSAVTDQYREPNGEIHSVSVPKEKSDQQSILSVLVDPLFGFNDERIPFDSYSSIADGEVKWRNNVLRLFYRAQSGSFSSGYQRKRFIIKSERSLETLVSHSLKEAEAVGLFGESGQRTLPYAVTGNPFRVYNDSQDNYYVATVEIRVHNYAKGSDVLFQYTDTYRPFSFQTLQSNFDRITSRRRKCQIQMIRRGIQ